jgi:hypothetical protein
MLQREHITAGRVRYIDKETSSMWAQGDDLSVITDNDEAGFRVVEYGKNRKVVLRDSLKREIQEAKLQRELRRRGIGQHTIEKALDAHVRGKTFRKIAAALAAPRPDRPSRRSTKWSPREVESGRRSQLPIPTEHPHKPTLNKTSG